MSIPGRRWNRLVLAVINLLKKIRFLKFPYLKELKKVIKKASKSDYDLYLKNLKDAEMVLLETRKKIEKEQIPMSMGKIKEWIQAVCDGQMKL